VFLIVGERPSGWAVLGGAVIVFTVLAHTFGASIRSSDKPKNLHY
jgi:hypothetical protein